MIRAFIANIKSGRASQGGSTITQQLAKNAFLTPEKRLTRKIKELILAVQLESRYSKDEIFALYLNQIPYGSNIYGVEAASQTYFSKPAKELTLGESASLAALLNAPTYYSPWGNNKNALLERKDFVLQRMFESKLITESELEIAKKEILEFAPPSFGGIKAPHFVLTVKELLAEKYGEDVVTNGGLRVVTSLDWKLQEIAERVVSDGAKRNEELYGGRNAALVAEDPKTGQILALVGSRDYFDESIDGSFNVPLQGLRQPGSALKPFVYLSAFEKGFHPKSILFDVEIDFNASGNPERSYVPHNFDGLFRGPVTMEEALAQSMNVPAVQTLYLAGLDNVLKKVDDFGITTLKERGRYGLSLVLGGGEVRLIELVGAYATLAERGVRHTQSMILEVKDTNNKILDEYHDETERVMDSLYPSIITDILSNKNLRSPLFQNSLGLTLFGEYDVALKTGTTNDYRDAWALGYSPSLTVGVWAGNSDNTPMHQQGSSILAAIPIWNAFLKEALPKYSPETFMREDYPPLPDRPLLNGQIFGTTQNGNTTTTQEIHSILYYVDKNNPLGPEPEDPSKDSQFENWEKGILEWAKTHVPGINLSGTSTTPAAGNTDSPKITNIAPGNGSLLTSPFTIQAHLESKTKIKRIEIIMNNRLLHQINGVNSLVYELSFLNKENLLRQNVIEVRVLNEAGKETIAPFIVFGKSE